jgi:cytochrome c biogenesis protein CcdA
MIPLIILTLYSGFMHAFEADHLLAVSSIVTRRNKTSTAIRDGVFWGLGHTSTIFCIGVIFLQIKFNIDPKIFQYFEALVGVMLLSLGIARLLKWKKASLDKHTHFPSLKTGFSFPTSYAIGLIHGLAGSGALMLIVLAKTNTTINGLGFLLLFGIGSIGGMMLAAALFSLPFGKRFFQHRTFQIFFILVSSILCIVYGIAIIRTNLISY